MKIIHTSDIHIGAKFAWMGEGSSKHRNSIKSSLERIVDLAINEAVSFIIFAGDIFDTSYPSDISINFFRDQLYRLSDNEIKSLIIPGNHDLLEESSVWTNEVWKSDKNIFVFKDNTPKFFAESKVWIYPSVIKTKKSKVSPLAPIVSEINKNAIDSDPNFHIVIAHGSLNLFGISDNFPISKDEIEKTKADYIALGDWHSTLDIGTNVKAYYSGSPDFINYSEKGSGNVLLIEFENSDYKKIVKVKIVPINSREFISLKLDLDIFDTAEKILAKIKTYINKEKSNIITISFVGVSKNGINLEEVIEQIRNEFYFIKYTVKEEPYTSMNFDFEHLFEEGTISSEFIKLLQQDIENNPDNMDLAKALNLGIKLLKGN